MSAARLILDEATRLLARFWKVSPPTDGQGTLLCEQVGGGTRRQRLQGAAGAGPRCLRVQPRAWPAAVVPSAGGTQRVAGKPPCLLSDVSDTALAAKAYSSSVPWCRARGLQPGRDPGPMLSTSVFLGGTLSTFYTRGNCGLGREAHTQDAEPGWKLQC